MPPASCHARACESQKQGRDENVSRARQHSYVSIEAEASSIDRDDERLKREEMRHSDEWSRWECMDLFDCFKNQLMESPEGAPETRVEGQHSSLAWLASR